VQCTLNFWLVHAQIETEFMDLIAFTSLSFMAFHLSLCFIAFYEALTKINKRSNYFITLQIPKKNLSFWICPEDCDPLFFKQYKFCILYIFYQHFLIHLFFWLSNNNFLLLMNKRNKMYIVGLIFIFLTTSSNQITILKRAFKEKRIWKKNHEMFSKMEI